MPCNLNEHKESCILVTLFDVPERRDGVNVGIRHVGLEFLTSFFWLGCAGLLYPNLWIAILHCRASTLPRLKFESMT